jgi:hypothetical protein
LRHVETIECEWQNAPLSASGLLLTKMFSFTALGKGRIESVLLDEPCALDQAQAALTA